MAVATSRVIALGLVVALLVAAFAPVPVRSQGGTTCAACTVLVGLFEQLAVVHSEEVIEAAKGFCETLGEPQLERACVIFLDRYGEQIIDGFVKNQTADVICLRTGLCIDPTCHLFPLPSKDVLAAVDPNEPKPVIIGPNDFAFCDMPVVAEFCKMLDRFVDGHLPLFQDDDLDSFSTFPTFRGWHWRGKDCNDEAVDIYPGRKVNNYGPEVDHNCNGIYGVDETGVSWEERLCGGANAPIGLVFLGDSATAHFSVPPTWVNASAINSETFSDLLLVASNELDWPQQSGSSGFLEEGHKDCPGPVDSIYKRLRNRNRCVHRDYHNIGVNGARTSSMENIVKSTNRNDTNDHPVIVTYALIGNDVCNSNPTTERMTTPEDFKLRVLNALNYLESTIPAGSHVMFIGLVDGRVLWDVMNAEIHPLNMTYHALYDYMNCLVISPCASWMNSNETYRNAASERAFELNQQYKDIISEYTFTKFDMDYYDYPIFEVIDYWTAQGGAAKDLIEATDGFHPSQLANALGAMFTWDHMLSVHPDWFGPENPNNALIDELFGDQGGH